VRRQALNVCGQEERRVVSLKGFFSRLVGGGAGEGASEAAPQLESVEHNGYRIRAAPYKAAGGWQTAGAIEKDFPDGTKTHDFVRAETHPSLDAAAEFSIAKAKQIIDQSGDRIFVKR
jgi:hypothetical protein